MLRAILKYFELKHAVMMTVMSAAGVCRGEGRGVHEYVLGGDSIENRVVKCFHS